MLEIVSGILIAVGGGIGLYIWQRRVVERISVQRIRSSSDKHVQGLLSLYGRLFPEDAGNNYTIEEVAEFMDVKPEAERQVEVENITLVAVVKGDVVGFILCHLYPERRKAIVSYFAIDENSDEGRKSAADRLLDKLKTLLIRSNKCDALFYESQGIDVKNSADERRKHRGRRLLFRLKARALGLKALEFQFPYQCAKVSLSQEPQQIPFSLFCIGIQESIPDSLSKDQLLEYLRFIYLDCYGDLYPKNDPRFGEHQAHLRRMLEHYEKTLPEVVLAVERGI